MNTEQNRWWMIDHDPTTRVSRNARQDAINKVLVGAPLDDRVELILSYCHGKRVLDIGCVDRTTEIENSEWLHRKISNVAVSCLGVDINAEGIAAMRALGYEAMVLDITENNLSMDQLGLFDVIVAAEIIEHLDKPGNLFANTQNLLNENGIMILTTPNPYVWRRVIAGRFTQLIESVDHVFYAYPSGIMELAERCGYHVELITSVSLYNMSRVFKEVGRFMRREFRERATRDSVFRSKTMSNGHGGLGKLFDEIGTTWTELPVWILTIILESFLPGVKGLRGRVFSKSCFMPLDLA